MPGASKCPTTRAARRAGRLGYRVGHPGWRSMRDGASAGHPLPAARRARHRRVDPLSEPGLHRRGRARRRGDAPRRLPRHRWLWRGSTSGSGRPAPRPRDPPGPHPRRSDRRARVRRRGPRQPDLHDHGRRPPHPTRASGRCVDPLSAQHAPRRARLRQRVRLRPVLAAIGGELGRLDHVRHGGSMGTYHRESPTATCTTTSASSRPTAKPSRRASSWAA